MAGAHLDPLERVDELEREVAELRSALAKQETWIPPGHFYSPIPDRDEVRRRSAQVFDRARAELPGIDLREEQQTELVLSFRDFYAEMPFGEEPSPDLRYWLAAEQYAYSDAIFLYCMLRHARPKRVVEVGSGFSSALMLDTRERFFDGELELTFVEPYPERLRSVFRPGDEEAVTLHELPVQDVPMEVFARLGDGDVLFVDSTHVAKTGSDVNHLFFEVLPRLARGVYVHVHDVHHPFEYPEEWVFEGRAWNEAYLLRAFLQFNAGFEVVLSNTFLELRHTDWFRKHMPLCLKDPGGSIWLRRT